MKVKNALSGTIATANQNTKDFAQFMQRRVKAAQDYVCGNPAKLDRIVSQHAPATFFGPAGGHVRGAWEVITTYDQGAGGFEPGSTTELEILHSNASGDVGYWVGFQHGLIRVKGKDKPVPMHLRVTEIFRFEDGGWKMVHRHADMLTTKESKPEKKPARASARKKSKKQPKKAP